MRRQPFSSFLFTFQSGPLYSPIHMAIVIHMAHVAGMTATATRMMAKMVIWVRALNFDGLLKRQDEIIVFIKRIYFM